MKRLFRFLTAIMLILTIFTFSACDSQIEEKPKDVDYKIEFSEVEIENHWRGNDWDADWYVWISGKIHNKSNTNYSLVHVEFEIFNNYGKSVLKIKEWYSLSAGATLTFGEGDLCHWTGKGYKITVLSAS